jgi:hypothetical protein
LSPLFKLQLGFGLHELFLPTDFSGNVVPQMDRPNPQGNKKKGEKDQNGNNKGAGGYDSGWPLDGASFSTPPIQMFGSHE